MTDPVVIDIVRVRGDTFPMQFTWQDAQGVGINIAGFSFLLTVDPSEEPTGSGANLFQLVGTIVDGPNGIFEFPISAPQADQTPAEYFHDIQMTDTSPSIRTIAKGKFTFKQDITK